MGCDGGTIPRRDELVRQKKKPEQKDKDAERSHKWRNCSLSQQTLQQPVVACGLGKLYSKSSVIEALLDKETKPEVINHIKNLKDIKDLKLTNNPAHISTEHTNGTVGDGSAPYICPISSLEMSGKFRFVFFWSCGCVLAERAMKEVKQNICLLCQQPFTEIDVIVINGNEDDVELLKVKMTARIANRKSKKNKPQKVEKVDVKVEPSTSGETSSISSAEIDTKQEVKEEPGSSNGKATKKEIDTIPLTLPRGKQIKGQFGLVKRSCPTELVQDPSYKKTKKDYSVAKDPQSSEVYKSLFTSHKDDKEQTRAHWVTYNPFYN